MKNIIYPVYVICLFVLNACDNDNLSPEVIVETPNRDEVAGFKEPLFNYTEQSEISPERFRLILQDDEPGEVVWSPAQRSFTTSELLQIRTASSEEFRITSYVLEPLKDVTIKARIPGYDEYFELLKIDSFPALGQFEFTPEFVLKKAIYKTENGNYLSFQLPAIPGQISYKVESPDPLWKKLSRIKVKWNFDFNVRGWGGSWKDMNVLYAREWLLMMTNYAYIVSTPEWEYMIDHWKEVTGSDMYSSVNNKTVIDYNALFRTARANRSATLGLTAIGGGLGGAGVVGVDHWNFYSHYRSQGYLAIAHEAGHWWGYGHDSSICNNYGYSDYSSVIMYLHDFMWKRNMIPYPDRELTKFVSYKGTPLFQHSGVDNGLYNYNVGQNYIADFFIDNPVEWEQ